MNIRTRQKCRLLRRHYDLFVLHIFNSITEEDKEYIRKRIREVMNNHENRRENT